jgi:hypothetical protein
MRNLVDRFLLWIAYKKYRYSELAQLNDISQMSFDELCMHLRHMDIQIIGQSPNLLRVKIEDEFTLYIIRYDGQGQFVSIEEESWKHFGA